MVYPGNTLRLLHAALVFIVIVVSCVGVIPAIAQTPGGLSLSPRLGISPPRVELRLDDMGRGSGEFQVLNMGETPMPVSLSIVTFELDDLGEVQLVPPTEQTLDQWLLVNPLNFDVAANGTQTIRFAVRPPVLPLPGEHRAMIYVTEQAPPGVTSGISLRMNYGLPIYAYMGQPDLQAVIHNVTLSSDDNNLSVNVDLENAGNAHIRPDGAVGIWTLTSYPGDGRARELLAAELDEDEEPPADGASYRSVVPQVPTLSGRRRTIATLMPRSELPAGALRVVISAQFGNVNVFNVFDLEN